MGSLALPGTLLAQRQRQAYNLVARGYSLGKVAKAIGVSETTVRKYIEARKNELSGVIDKINRDDYATLLLSRFEQSRTEAWNMVERAKNDTQRARALKLVMDVDTNEAKMLQSLGLLDQAAKKEERKVETTIKIEQVNREHLDALAAKMLADKMGISPEEAIEMCGHSRKALEARKRMVESPAEKFEEPIEEAEIVPMTDPLDLD